jgi:hypothetical protein
VSRRAALALALVLSLGGRAAAAPEDGAELAQRHCQSCHLLPRPEHLPRETWPFVLTWMGNYLGFRKLEPPFQRLVGAHLVPAQPVLSQQEFARLSAWFRDGAPTRAEFRLKRKNPPLVRFRPVPFDAGLPPGELVTLVRVDPARGQVFAAAGRSRELHVVDRRGQQIFRGGFASEPIHVEPFDGGFRLALLGTLDQSQTSAGRVLDLRREAAGDFRRRMLVQGFPRLVQSLGSDLDQDGREDLLLLGFGDGYGPGFGRVSILWRTEGFDAAFRDAPAVLDAPFLPGAFREQVLLDRAGALGADVRDFDGDGRPDVMLLTAQAHQELLLYLNRGERRFEPRLLVEQFPSFGYNQLLVADFDGDGRADVLTVNGNNMEIPEPPPRPYHGIRILRQEGPLEFRERYFYPMHGAMQARAADFDADGDLDVAAVAFYPDWEAEEPETFTYLENLGGLRFAASSLGGEHWGRWMVLDAGDVDGDGRPDLVLGAGNAPGGGLHPGHAAAFERYRARLSRAPSLLLLKSR